ncbi:Dihydroorotate dehydrogenase (quinone), mitochondrial [Irineochytrium annulatum]|nr:Dihydroorotate dehydrogenase (quinone), mitochondrial [Irineochytrium annulatum]
MMPPSTVLRPAFLARGPARLSRFRRTYSTYGDSAASAASRVAGKTLRFVKWTVGIAGTGLLVIYLSDSRAAAWKNVVMPVIHYTMDPEDAHVWAIWLASVGLAPKDRSRETDDERLKMKIWGKELSNPIGLAAGFDKHAQAIDPMLSLGFGLVEIGSVTPKPQPGNPKPRMFRLLPDRAVINRYGFNSDGHAEVEARLRARIRDHLHSVARDGVSPDPAEKEAYGLAPTKGVPRSLHPGRLLGVNLGKNKLSPADSDEDYIRGVATLGPFADYLVVNVSSPNTPGLRSLQRREPMGRLLQMVRRERDEKLPHRPPILVKVAPDMTKEQMEDVAAVVLESKIDGVIVGNTTISRPRALMSDPKTIEETGGLSGPPLLPLALSQVRLLYSLVGGRVPIIGCGGITTAGDAIAYARAGASVVQIYTGLAYEGPGLVADIKSGIVERLRKEKKTWADVIGSDHKEG